MVNISINNVTLDFKRFWCNEFDLNINFVNVDEFENRLLPYEDDEQEDDNDTNITDDEENVDVGVRKCVY